MHLNVCVFIRKSIRDQSFLMVGGGAEDITGGHFKISTIQEGGRSKLGNQEGGS